MDTILIDTGIFNKVGGQAWFEENYPDFNIYTKTTGSVYKGGQNIVLQPANLTAVQFVRKPVTTA